MSNDPYVSPSSNLETNVPVRRGWGWKVYFGIMVLLTMFGIFGYTLMENVGVAEIIGGILIVPAYSAFYGYVFSKRILFRKIWAVNFIIQLFWGVSYYFVTKVDLSVGMDQQSFVIYQGIMWVISLPFYIGLYSYGFRSEQLWSKT